MELIFWQNILSPHQAPFLRALAELGHEVTVVTAAAMTRDRLDLGWQTPEMGLARVVVGPRDGEIEALIASSSHEAVQVMAGARGTRFGNVALGHVRRLKRRVGIMTEAPDPRGLTGLARWAKYTRERCTRGWRYDFVLAMGEMGVRWFRACGYREARLFPFAYVTEPVSTPSEPASRNQFSALYVGQFIVRKGLDLLLRGLAAATANHSQLRLLGTGPEQSALQQLARKLGIEADVVWLARQDAAGVQREMARADVTLLPSRHDGWGAVVNESLMAGTPVICSDACGAAELIRHPWLGSVIRAGSVNELCGALRKWIECGKRKPEERVQIQRWADCITGDVVAVYFAAIMEHVYAGATKPRAPWRGAQLNSGLVAVPGSV